MAPSPPNEAPVPPEAIDTVDAPDPSVFVCVLVEPAADEAQSTVACKMSVTKPSAKRAHADSESNDDDPHPRPATRMAPSPPNEVQVPPEAIDWTVELEKRLFTQHSAVNCYDTLLSNARLSEVEKIIRNMRDEERALFAARVGKKMKKLAKVKADLTQPTRRGGFNQALSDLNDRDLFFAHAHWMLANTPPFV